MIPTSTDLSGFGIDQTVLMNSCSGVRWKLPPRIWCGSNRGVTTRTTALTHARLMAFLIPGVILMLAWSVVIPVKVVEKTEIIQTFRRSAALTKGFRWQILALSLVYILLQVVLEVVIDLVFGFPFFASPADANSPSVLIWGWAERVVIVAIAAVGIASTYVELRLVKEGVGAENLSQMLD